MRIDNYTSNAQPFYVLLDHDKSSLVSPKGFANPPVDVNEYREFSVRGLEEFNKRKRLTTVRPSRRVERPLIPTTRPVLFFSAKPAELLRAS
jgi:hypothetical protein